MKNVPWHSEVVEFCRLLTDRLPQYEISCEHEHSNCVLISHTKVVTLASGTVYETGPIFLYSVLSPCLCYSFLLMANGGRGLTMRNSMSCTRDSVALVQHSHHQITWHWHQTGRHMGQRNRGLTHPRLVIIGRKQLLNNSPQLYCSWSFISSCWNC